MISIRKTPTVATGLVFSAFADVSLLLENKFEINPLVLFLKIILRG